MKYSISILIFIISLVGFSQEEWISLNTRFESNSSRVREAIPVVDKSNSNFAFFLREFNGITGYLFNDEQKLIGEMKALSRPKKTPIFTGAAIKDKRVTLFYKNKSGRKFASIEFDFETKSFKIKEQLEVNLNREVIVDYFTDDDVLHVLTIEYATSLVTLYTLDVDSNIIKKTIDLTNEKFKGIEDGKFYYLYFGQGGYGKVSQIFMKEPTSLEMASSSSKAYFENDIIILTTDYQDEYTYALNINIKDGSYFIEEFENKNLKKEELRSKSNSFIYKNFFFHVYATSSRLVFSIYDRTTKNLIKEFNIREDLEIDFKNTPIMLEGGDLSNYRELEKTKQFLRKIYKSNLGVSVYEQEGEYVVTIGSSEEIPGVDFAYFGGGFIGGISAGLWSSFYSYARTKSTRIICLFDEEFNHIEGEVLPNGFDVIKYYTSDLKTNGQDYETIFKYKDLYIRGVYDKRLGTYQFIQFSVD